MKYFLILMMMFLLASSLFNFWMHDLTGTVTSLATFGFIRFAVEKLKNDHQKN